MLVGVVDPISFEQFVADRLPDLLRYAADRSGDRDLAHDIVAAVLARAEAQWHRIGSTASPELYIQRMIVGEKKTASYLLRMKGKVSDGAEVFRRLEDALPSIEAALA